MAINHLLVTTACELEGREVSPTAGMSDSQSVKSTKSGGISSHDTDIQNRDGGADLIKAIRNHYPWLRILFADGGYSGETFAPALSDPGPWPLAIIMRSDTAQGFVVLPGAMGRGEDLPIAQAMTAAGQGWGKEHRAFHHMDVHYSCPNPNTTTNKILFCTANLQVKHQTLRELRASIVNNGPSSARSRSVAQRVLP